jgi:hypothetical protein
MSLGCNRARTRSSPIEGPARKRGSSDPTITSSEAGLLAKDINGSVVKIDDLHSVIRIADMRGSFSLQRDHVIMLCEAFSDRALTPEALTTIGFALQASDAFEWEGEVISEVLSDWSAPEVNFELNAETLNMHRDWLLGFGEPPVRNSVDPLNRIQGRLISVRIKTTY